MKMPPKNPSPRGGNSVLIDPSPGNRGSGSVGGFKESVWRDCDDVGTAMIVMAVVVAVVVVMRVVTYGCKNDGRKEIQSAFPPLRLRPP